MKKTLLFAIIGILLGCASCSKPFPHVADKQLLEEFPCVVNELQTAIQVPIGFMTISQSYTDSIAAIRAQENPFDSRLLRIFADTVLNANISLSDMRHIPYEKTENDLDFYKVTYNAHGFWDSVQLQRYYNEQYPKIILLEMQNKERTLVRVFFYNQDKAQFCIDYYFATAFYNDFMPFINASIASVAPNYELQIEVE